MAEQAAVQQTVQQAQQSIEGITPTMLWTFMVVLVGLMALVVLGDKVMDVFRNAQKRKKEKQELDGQDITDRIADKVLEKLTPTLDAKFDEISKNFDDIDKKLAADKEAIDMHTRQLNAQEGRVDRLDNDTRALLHGVSALLGHEIDGNSIDKVKRTNDAMKNYLIDRKYKEDDWK